MKSLAQSHFPVCVLFVGYLCLPFAPDARGEVRVWKSANGKFEVQAEMISSDSESVTLHTEDGRKLTVALNKLSDADRKFVLESRDDETGAKETEKQIRRVFAQFYQAVGDDDETLREFLSDQGQAHFDSSPTFFDSVRGPDRGHRPKISKIRIDENETAEADYRLRLEGKNWRMQMLFARQNEQWRVTAIIGTGEDGKLNKMDFETAQMISDFDESTASTTTVAESSSTLSPRFAAQGAAAYKTGFCVKCHGQNGKGTARGPDLTDSQWDHCDGTVEGIRQVLVSGVPKGSLVDSSRQFGMNPATNLVQESELDALAAYVHGMSAN